jgi:hypothetical protein
VNLRALHIIYFRNNDTCIWVTRESLHFIVDSLSHRPELKLEWIAMADDRVDRIVRNAGDGKDGSSRGRGKAKTSTATTLSFGGVQAGTYPVILPPESSESESESSDEEGPGHHNSQLRYRTFGPILFHDVWGIKIFEKEMRTGCL